MNLVLRPARPEDADLLFDWVNRPDSLAGKLRTAGPIARAEHDAWFQERLADSGCRIWIASARGERVGQVRLTRSAEGWEIDIYVVADRRDGGLGRRMVKRALSLLRREHAGAHVLARVKHANTASRRLFEGAGFRVAALADDHVVLAAGLVEGS